MKDRRIGVFSLKREIVERYPDWVRAIMAACIVVKCEMDYSQDRFYYCASSPHFAELSEGQVLPTYTWQITMDNQLGQITVGVAHD